MADLHLIKDEMAYHSLSPSSIALLKNRSLGFPIFFQFDHQQKSNLTN